MQTAQPQNRFSGSKTGARLPPPDFEPAALETNRIRSGGGTEIRLGWLGLAAASSGLQLLELAVLTAYLAGESFPESLAHPTVTPTPTF